MTKIRFYFLAAIFLTVPIVYAWLYIPFMSGTLADAIPYIFSGLRWTGFESVKVLVFLLFMIGALVSFFSEYTVREKYNISRVFLLSLLVFFVWSVSSYFLNKNINPYVFTGNQEKTHGLVFYA